MSDFSDFDDQEGVEEPYLESGDETIREEEEEEVSQEFFNSSLFKKN